MNTKSLCLLMLAFVLLGLTSCSPSKEALFINTWRIDNIDDKGVFEGSEPHQKIFKNFKENAYFIFKENGRYFFDLVTTKQEGEWKYDSKKETLTTAADSGELTVAKIFELSEGKLVMEQAGEGNPVVLTLVPSTSK